MIIRQGLRGERERTFFPDQDLLASQVIIASF